LTAIAIYKPDDVRPILEKYLGKDVPIEYAIEEAKHKEAFLQEWREKNKGRLNPSGGLGSGGFTISSLFGGVRFLRVNHGNTADRLHFTGWHATCGREERAVDISGAEA